MVSFQQMAFSSSSSILDRFSTTDDPSTSESNEKEPSLVPGMVKIKQLMPVMPSHSLLEQSARALAEAWMRDHDLVPDFSDNTLQSEMGIIFKAQIAIYLTGMFLVQWIRSQNGLKSLADKVWPDQFQKLLTAIFQQIDSASECHSIKSTLRFLLEDYKKSVGQSQDLQHTLHRLGLTRFFCQKTVHLNDTLKLFYYWHLEDRSPNFRGVLPMVYPMPFVLQSCCRKTKDFRTAFYANSNSIQEKKREWLLRVTAQEAQEEDEGKTISSQTFQKQNAVYQAYCEKYTSAERFMSCISVMVRSQVNQSYPVVLVAALFSLVHPFYSGKHELDYPSLRLFRVDIFWFLSRALCSFYAQLDLPLVCFFMAQQSMGSVPCLSERLRCALCFQTIAIHYGHWQAAAETFEEWHSQVPAASWLFEELVYQHIVGLFWQIENLLVEIYINIILHRKCKKICNEKQLSEPISKLRLLNYKARSVTYEVMCTNTSLPSFLDNMDIVQCLCEYFSVTADKIQNQNNQVMYDDILKNVWQKLQKNTEFNTSRHLTPFMKMLPYFVNSSFFWDKLIETNTVTIKRMLQSFSLLEMPKTYADRLFSLVSCMLHHHYGNSFAHVIQATLDAYLKSTAGRHYRIPLLRKLLQVYSNPNSHQLTIEPNKTNPHSNLSASESSAIHMTLRDIEAFSVTATDARNDFENVDVSNDEKLIMYMKKRDPLMPAWIDTGLDAIRFADCL